jgi:hypothetical protein
MEFPSVNFPEPIYLVLP